MFSTLKPGNTVHVLEQEDKLAYKTGLIVSVVPNYTGSMDMKVKIDGKEYEFKLLPFNNSVAKNGSVIVSETKEAIVTELMKLKENSETILNNIDYHKNMVNECETLLRQMNPSYDKEIRRDEEIDLLKQQVLNMSQSLANIEQLLKNKSE